MENAEKNRKNIGRNTGNSKNKGILLAAAGVLILLILGVVIGLFLKQKRENESTVAEEGSEFQEIVQQGQDYLENLNTFQYYEIDGDRYELGDTLADFLANGWEVAGSPDDTEWIYSESDTVEGEESVLIFLAKGEEEFFQMCLLNTENSARPYAECMVNGFDVDESNFMEVKSITINGQEIWGLTVDEANDLFENQSEEAGKCFFYFNIPEEQSTQGEMTMIGWSVYAGDESGDGTIDRISFSQDYQFE